MNGVSDLPSPGIRLALAAGRVRVERDGVGIERTLCKRPIEAALRLIPTLLPVCGVAQQLAALRAAMAAGYRQDTIRARTLAAKVPQEQLEACTWRLAIDWPRLLGEAPDIEAVKSMRTAGDRVARKAVAAKLLPGFENVRELGDVRVWASDRHCTAARLLALACGLSDEAGNHALLKGDALLKAASARLASADAAPAMAVEVGPLAMQRDPLMEAAPAASVNNRLAAALFDFRYLLDDLTQESTVNQWTEPDGSGLGRAQTARGPLFHRVILNHDGSQAVRWQLLAPTDWHFGAGGPIEAAKTTDDALPWLALSFDPCAPWRIVPEQELAHA